MIGTAISFIGLMLIWFHMVLASYNWVIDRRADIQLAESRGYTYTLTEMDKVAEVILGAKIRP